MIMDAPNLNCIQFFCLISMIRRGFLPGALCRSPNTISGVRSKKPISLFQLIPHWTAYRKIDSEIKHPPVVELRKSKLRQEGRFMSRSYTHVQELLPSVLAMKGKGYTYRQIAKQFGLAKEQVEELCSRARRKQRRIEKGYIPQPKGRPRKTPATQEQLQNNRIVELEMKVELLQNFLSECGRM